MHRCVGTGYILLSVFVALFLFSVRFLVNVQLYVAICIVVIPRINGSFCMCIGPASNCVYICRVVRPTAGSSWLVSPLCVKRYYCSPPLMLS